MQEISKKQYIKNIYDYEKLYLIIVEDNKIYLRADIENEENLRIEMMYFEMNTSLTFFEANNECRGRYCGGIYIFDYDNESEIIKDFLNIEQEAIFLICEDNDLKNILHKYRNKKIYVVTK